MLIISRLSLKKILSTNEDFSLETSKMAESSSDPQQSMWGNFWLEAILVFLEDRFWFPHV